jgi:hypothetical protein
VENSEQCKTGLEGTALNNKCDIYNNECKLKCINVDNDIECNERSSECFWLNSDPSSETTTWGECVEKV